MEFEINNESLSALRAITITANFPELYSWLDTELQPYLNMAVTEETIPAAKTYRANLRKLKDRIEQYRKEAKAAALASYNKFEADCKIATGKIDAAVDNIDSQVKSYEDSEKANKLAELKEFYDSSLDTEAKEYCPWESIVNPKWANKTYSIDDAKDEILTALYNTSVNLESIRTMTDVDTAYLLTVYKDTRDINAVIRKVYEIKAAKEREEQRKKEAEAKKAVEVQAKHEEEFFEEESDPMCSVPFRVTCRKSQLVLLGQYMKRNGIKYERA